MGGRAWIRGMRIPVSVIVRQIAHGATVEDILRGCPDLRREDVQQAIEYAAWLSEEEIHAPWACMRFLVDTCVDSRVAAWPRSAGHDAVHLRDQGLQRLANGEIFRKATAERRTVVTFDLDFSEIAASRSEWASVISLRLNNAAMSMSWSA
jgi:uncharacterized protein (DUF433 family)/predicted nuclease of predicted toxin-antitoxin system